MTSLAGSVPSSPLSHRDTRLIVIAVLLPVFMGSLDNTNLATALPTIGREFGDVRNLPWLITAYLIASTAIIPLYGKIADIHGRRFTLLIAIVIYMAGSLACALAPNMLVLVLGRALHGLGGGGLSSLGMVVLGDVAAPKDRGRYYSYFSLVYTTSGACGPALGGFFAEYLHWSVIFWVNIPMGFAAFAVCYVLLRRLPRHERPHRLDFLGAALIMVSSVAFMLGLSTGGVRYPWTSPPVLGLFALGLVFGAAFVVRLATAPEPLIPISMLKDPIARCGIAANGFGWGAIMGLNIFLPMFLQSVIGLSASASGLGLMVFMIAVNLSAAAAGQTIGRQRRYKIVPMIGLGLAVAAVLAMAVQVAELTTMRFELLLTLVGLGFGPIPPLAGVVLQNTVPAHQFGIAIGTMNFTRNLYGTILIAVFGAIVMAGPEAAGGAGLVDDPASGFAIIFVIAAASLSAAFVSLALLEQKPLQSTLTPQ
jgi:EmrB/QacA subfamily drug resistance transporter